METLAGTQPEDTSLEFELTIRAKGNADDGACN